MVDVNIVDKCSGCGMCVDICPIGLFEQTVNGDKKTSKVVAADQCFACRGCEVKCPEQAITITGYEIRKVDPPFRVPS